MRDVDPSPELQEQVALVLMWNVCQPFARGLPAPQQEKLEREMRVPGEITRRISDKLIRKGLLSLAGESGDHLVPGRALDLIRVGDVLHAVRDDEEGVVHRLPAVLPSDVVPEIRVDQTRSFADLMQSTDSSAAGEPLGQET